MSSKVPVPWKKEQETRQGWGGSLTPNTCAMASTDLGGRRKSFIHWWEQPCFRENFLIQRIPRGEEAKAISEWIKPCFLSQLCILTSHWFGRKRTQKTLTVITWVISRVSHCKSLPGSFREAHPIQLRFLTGSILSLAGAPWRKPPSTELTFNLPQVAHM